LVVCVWGWACWASEEGAAANRPAIRQAETIGIDEVRAMKYLFCISIMISPTTWS
jgi:hypothetical protein